MSNTNTDNFIRSADDTYNHPAAGSGGFGGGNPLSHSSGDHVGHDHSSHDHSSHGHSHTSGQGLDSGLGGGHTGTGDRQFGSGQTTHHDGFGSSTGTAETIATYGGQRGSEGHQSSGNTGYGAPGAGAGLGTDLDSARLASRQSHGTDEYTYGGNSTGSRGIGGDSQQYNTGSNTNTSTGTGSGHHASQYGSGAPLAGAAAVGATAAGSLGAGAFNRGGEPDLSKDYSGVRSGADSSAGAHLQHGSSNTHSTSIGGATSGAFGSSTGGSKTDQLKGAANELTGPGTSGGNLTGNRKVDDAIGQKVNENTDKDGFANLTGDKQPAGGALTGRVKPNTDDPKHTVVETTKQRSDRDEQGRELDSYGKPYDL